MQSLTVWLKLECSAQSNKAWVRSCAVIHSLTWSTQLNLTKPGYDLVQSFTVWLESAQLNLTKPGYNLVQSFTVWLKLEYSAQSNKAWVRSCAVIHSLAWSTQLNLTKPGYDLVQSFTVWLGVLKQSLGTILCSHSQSGLEYSAQSNKAWV